MTAADGWMVRLHERISDKAKIVFSFFQIVVLLPKVYLVAWPATFSNYVNIFRRGCSRSQKKNSIYEGTPGIISSSPPTTTNSSPPLPPSLHPLPPSSSLRLFLPDAFSLLGLNYWAILPVECFVPKSYYLGLYVQARAWMPHLRGPAVLLPLHASLALVRPRPTLQLSPPSPLSTPLLIRACSLW